MRGKWMGKSDGMKGKWTRSVSVSVLIKKLMKEKWMRKMAERKVDDHYKSLIVQWPARNFCF